MSTVALKLLAAAVSAAALAGCASLAPPQSPVTTQAFYPSQTVTERMLGELPPPGQPVAVAVYGFNDETGQFKPSDAGQTLSRAISQGGASMLIRSLQEAGQRRWFTVVERESFKDLLSERQVITEMRERYLGEKGVNPRALPALLFAGVLLEGGVIGYDTNTHTGGIGAALLGISLDAKWRQDTVTVYLRAVSVKTGEVLTSVTASKTITSAQVDADAFKYVDADKILQTDNGLTSNEPGQMALQQAIDKAVYGVVMEGVDLKLWNFADTNAGWPMLWRYRQERSGVMNAATVAHEDARDAKARARAHPQDQARGAPPPPPQPSSRPQTRAGGTGTGAQFPAQTGG